MQMIEVSISALNCTNLPLALSKTFAYSHKRCKRVEIMFTSGQVLQGHYQLQHLLGRSTQARQTWLAQDLSTTPHQQVVIKLLVFTRMQWQDLKLFEREAQVLQKLAHAYIPRYRDYFLVDQQPDSSLCWWGLVQDYVVGQSLEDLLKQGHQFTEKDVRGIAENVLQILIYLHGLSPPVLHRDIKPSNLVLDSAQQIWLVDFGSVQDQGSVTGVSFTVVGTVGYAPMEQFWGRSTAASDLYALGATLIHLLTGVAPVDLPQRDLKIHFRDRVRADANFINWIEKLTEPAVEKRFGSANGALQALGQEIFPEITPIGERVVMVRSSFKKNQGSRLCVVKKIPSRVLEIELRELSHISNDALLNMFYFLWGFISFVLLLFSVGASALVIAFIIAYCVSMGVTVREARRKDPKNANSIRLDAVSNFFEVTSRGRFSKKQELGLISSIRYFSIASYQEYFSYYATYTFWVVNIRANQNYIVNWRLSEEECIWLVNEIQSWLDTVTPSYECRSSFRSVLSPKN